MKRALIAALALASISCGDMVRQGTGSSYLIITRLGPPGASGDMNSDVLTNATIVGDLAEVEFALGLKDPGSADSPTAPSPNNFITVDRYRVRYVRADGRNTPGVDVPYPFDGAITLTVPSVTLANFTVVRAQAKAEAPLGALRTSPIVLSTIAEITFFGRDQTGREVQATGKIGVHFANFGDPD